MKEEIERMEKENLKQAQGNYEDTFGNDAYKLKTDEEIIKFIEDFGYGETEFHTADVERLRWEKEFWKNKYIDLRKGDKE